MPRVYSSLKHYFKLEGKGTQAELARELAISPAQLSYIKWGHREPRIELALRIAERCHVPLESLIQPPKPRPKRMAKATKAARPPISKAS